MPTESKAFWTAFCLSEESDPNKLHCTHKYLGTLTDIEAAEVQSAIDKFFAKTNFKFFEVDFNNSGYFGEHVKVLMTRTTHAFDRYDPLRAILDLYHDDDYDYRPHITTDQNPPFKAGFNRYVLMHGKDIVQAWGSKPIRNTLYAMPPPAVELLAIREVFKDYDAIEHHILAVFRELFYRPLLAEVGLSYSEDEVLKNAKKEEDELIDALRTGKVVFSFGKFHGKFSARVTKELRELGAKWDAKTSTFKLNLSQIPPSLKMVIYASEARIEVQMKRLDDKVAQILPAKIADAIKVSDMLDTNLWKLDKRIQKTLEGVTVSPTLTPEQRRKIADEWQDNLRFWIKDFTADEIVRLRERIQRNTYRGLRRDQVEQAIKRSFGVTANKAKFLARQETSLLMAKVKETRYRDAGVNEYKWRCVAGSPKHPVRPAHKKLDGTIQRWDDPPVTTSLSEPTRRNNPGQDYNCRCTAIPVVRFKKGPP